MNESTSAYFAVHVEQMLIMLRRCIMRLRQIGIVQRIVF